MPFSQAEVEKSSLAVLKRHLRDEEKREKSDALYVKRLIKLRKKKKISAKEYIQARINNRYQNHTPSFFDQDRNWFSRLIESYFENRAYRKFKKELKLSQGEVV